MQHCLQRGFSGSRRREELFPFGSVLSSVQLLLKRSLSSSTINCHVPEICCNVGFEERLVFNHPLLKHFLQGVRCQHPVISGVAGGSWHPFKRAVGQCLFLAFINSFKVPAANSKYLWAPATFLKSLLSFCNHPMTLKVKIKFTEKCYTSPFLYIN